MTFLALPVLAANVARAGDAGGLDWSTWQQMPVFERGRMMPLDTFARAAVEKICGTANPTLKLEGALPGEKIDAARFAQARRLFPDGKPRKFTAAELLFSWLVEPEKWQQVPMLAAKDRELRGDVLDVPLTDKGGRRLEYVSLRQLEYAPYLGSRQELIRQRAQVEGKKFKLEGLDKRLEELLDAYNRYRLVTFDPAAQHEPPRRFLQRLEEVIKTWGKLAGHLQRSGVLDPEGETAALLGQAADALRKLVVLFHGGRYSWEQVDDEVSGFRQAVIELARQLADHPSKPVAYLSADLASQTTEMHLALYDNGHALRLVPALSPGALEENRVPGDDAQPWLSLRTLICGSEDVLREYPRREVAEVRKAFGEVKAAYLQRDHPDRPRRFADAMDRFADAVRRLGQRVEPLRKELPIRHKDEALITLTAYPPPGSTRVEVHYNRVDPFYWSWVVSLVAIGCLGLSFVVMRKAMFWTGIVILIAAQMFTLYGFALRTSITGLLPVTNMFETVVFVALCVAILGMWFAMLPLFGPGLTAAWQLAGVLGRRQAQPLRQELAALAKPRLWSKLGWALWVPRLALLIATFWWLSTIFDLLPRLALGSLFSVANDLLIWLSKWCVVGLVLWYLPRGVLAAVLAVATVRSDLRRRGLAEPLGETVRRKVFVMVAAVSSFLLALLAYYAPASVFSKEIGSAMPIIRDNFWLFVHVVTIVASYGPGILAWGLGNIAMAYYLFGRYRHAGQPPDPTRGTAPRRPPEPCALLARSVYRAIQLAVLLLAAGTILGALWADVAWGRFWSWDRKEVWALITLLVYLGILHGRQVGWFGNFGLAAGSVLGMTAIVMAWYGVNFVLGSPLHAYGEGAGGKWYVIICALCNWLFVLQAAVRYNMEIRAGVAADR